MPSLYFTWKHTGAIYDSRIVTSGRSRSVHAILAIVSPVARPGRNVCPRKHAVLPTRARLAVW